MAAPFPTLLLSDPEFHPPSRKDDRARPVVQPVEPTDRTCSAGSGAAASALRTAGLVLEGPVASQEPAMINTKPAAVPGVNGSASSVTPASSATAGFT